MLQEMEDLLNWVTGKQSRRMVVVATVTDDKMDSSSDADNSSSSGDSANSELALSHRQRRRYDMANKGRRAYGVDA